MDLSKLSPSQQITVGAAAAMLLISFFPWFGISGLIGFSGWNSGFTGVIGMLAIVGAGVVLLMEAMDNAPFESPADIAFYLAATGLVLLILRILFTWGAPRRIGIYLAVIAAAVAAWGAYRNRVDNS